MITPPGAWENPRVIYSIFYCTIRTRFRLVSRAIRLLACSSVESCNERKLSLYLNAAESVRTVGLRAQVTGAERASADLTRLSLCVCLPPREYSDERSREERRTEFGGSPSQLSPCHGCGNSRWAREIRSRGCRCVSTAATLHHRTLPLVPCPHSAPSLSKISNR